MTTEEILKDCEVQGTVVKLPNVQLDRKAYLDVKKRLELIGGKWKGGKTQGFVFTNDPSELLGQVANGEKRNLKKEYQFFATPHELALKLVKLAKIEQGHLILEPSAGRGAIVKAISEEVGNLERNVHCVELMEINRTFLKDVQRVEIVGDDFMKSIPMQSYDRIIANPPFSKNQDIDHILHMYGHLKNGGRLVSISSAHWKLSANKKETQFRNWLEDVEADIIPIEKGVFKESGTMVGGFIIVIDMAK